MRRCLSFLRILAVALAFALILPFAAAESFALPAETQIIRPHAFENDAALTGVLEFPEGVTVIGSFAFAGCENLTGIAPLPAGLTTIAAHAFDGCTGLTGTLYIPYGVEVDPTAFDNCPSLFVTRTDPLHPRVAVLPDAELPEDGSLNQMTYEAVSAYCDEFGLDCTWFSGERAISNAVAAGYDVLFFPGFLHQEGLQDYIAQYPGVRFITLDFEVDDPQVNTFCALYKEEQAGFMAGYAAVRMGYRHLGFMGGMQFVGGVVRYGQGFLRGANQAAAELGITDQVTVEYTYTGVFWDTPEVRATATDWYTNKNVEVIFCCGGSMCEGVREVLKDLPEAKVIGVDVDQKAFFDEYAPGAAVTSAVKNMFATVTMVLSTIQDDRWSELGGSTQTLGLVGGVPARNHVTLAGSTEFNDGFTPTVYRDLINNLLNGTYDPSSGELMITVNYHG